MSDNKKHCAYCPGEHFAHDPAAISWARGDRENDERRALAVLEARVRAETWRDAIEAAAQRVESRDEERQALARVIRSLTPPERGAATAATCGTCGDAKFITEQFMGGYDSFGNYTPPSEPRRVPCPDCATPQQAATGTGGDAIEAPGDGYPATNGDMRPPADAKAATCATCNDTGSVETEPCPYIDHSWHRRPR